jgi:hypothetical protein
MIVILSIAVAIAHGQLLQISPVRLHSAVKYLLAAFVGLIIIVLAFGFLSRSLKRLIKIKTKSLEREIADRKTEIMISKCRDHYLTLAESVYACAWEYDIRSDLRYCAELTARGEDHSFEYRFLTNDGHVFRLNDAVGGEMKNGRSAVMRILMIDAMARGWQRRN